MNKNLSNTFIYYFLLDFFIYKNLTILKYGKIWLGTAVLFKKKKFFVEFVKSYEVFPSYNIAWFA